MSKSLYESYDKDERFELLYQGESKCPECKFCDIGWEYEDNFKIQNFYCNGVKDFIDPCLIDLCGMFERRDIL